MAGKVFALACIRCAAGGTYRLLLVWYCCLVVRSWEPMQFHVRTPVRIFCALTVILAGCEANPSVVEEADSKPATAQFIAQSGHSPPFARTPFAPFTRAEAVGIALQEWRLFGQRVDDNPPQAHFEPAAGEDPARMPGQWERIGEYWWLGQDADRRESAWTGMYDENGQQIDANRDDYYAWSAAFIAAGGWVLLQETTRKTASATGKTKSLRARADPRLVRACPGCMGTVSAGKVCAVPVCAGPVCAAPVCTGPVCASPSGI